MSALLDEDTTTVVLDALDFEVTCEARRGKAGDRCGAEATHQIVCVECEHVTGVVCIDHGIWARRSPRKCTHSECGASGRMCDLVKVVPL